MGETINGKTLGIIGLGKIGKRLVEITSGFNLELLACDLYRDEDFAKKYSIEYCDMDYLCSNAEIISIHANSKNSDKHLISRDQISLMNTKTLLINTSRGNNVDELALLVPHGLLLVHHQAAHSRGGAHALRAFAAADGGHGVAAGLLADGAARAGAAAGGLRPARFLTHRTCLPVDDSRARGGECRAHGRAAGETPNNAISCVFSAATSHPP